MVVDLVFIVAPIVLCCFMPVSIYSRPLVVWLLSVSTGDDAVVVD